MIVLVNLVFKDQITNTGQYLKLMMNTYEFVSIELYESLRSPYLPGTDNDNKTLRVSE